MRPVILIALLLLAAPGQAQRIEFPKSLDQLAARASEKVEIDLDADMLSFAGKVLSDSNPEELAAKQLIATLKGIYVRSYKFASDGQFAASDMRAIQDQLLIFAGRPWSRSFMTTQPETVKNKKELKPIGPMTPPNNQQIEVWMYRVMSEEARKRRAGTTTTVTGSDPDGRAVESMVVLATSAREFTIVNIVGPIRPEDFAALGGRLGIPKINLPLKKEDQ